MKEIKELSQYTLKYINHYTDGKNVPNLPTESIYSLVYRSLKEIYKYNYNLPTFKQIDIILYLLDFNEHYTTGYFLTTYEILFTRLDFDNIINKNHVNSKQQTNDRIKELLTTIINKEEDVKKYVRLSTNKRITGLAYCVKNNYLKRIN